MGKKALAFLLSMLIALASFGALSSGEHGIAAALLVGMDTFVSHSRLNPAAANNMEAMAGALLSAGEPVRVSLAYGQVGNCMEGCSLIEQAVVSPESLQDAMALAYAGTGENETVLLYLCTHGEWDGEKCGLVLSDGETECLLTPETLTELLEPWKGRILVILDACHSGAFIGRGTGGRRVNPFGDIPVLTSCLAAEDSWYWLDASGGAQGSFYFTRQLASGISPDTGYPADLDGDGVLWLSELEQWLLGAFAVSTPQLSGDDRVLLSCGKTGGTASVKDIVVSDTAPGVFELGFTVTRPVCVAYQLVRRKEDGWDFAGARVLYDQEENYADLNGLAGAVGAGRKIRTFDLSESQDDYVLLQLITLEDGVIRVHGSALLTRYTSGAEKVTVESAGDGLWHVMIAHSEPCRMTVSVCGENGEEFARLATVMPSRPGVPGGTELFFQTGEQETGAKRIKVRVIWNGGSETLMSEAFQAGEVLP